MKAAKSHSQKWSLMVNLGLIALIALGFWGARSFVHIEDAWERGEVAKPFQLAVISDDPTVQGVRLDDFHDQFVLVNFWASWCNICREESKHLRVLSRVLGHKLPIVAIASYDNALNIRESVRFKTAEYIIANDPDGQTAIDYKVPGLPMTVLIDPSGNIVERWSGPMTNERVELLIERFRETDKHPTIGANSTVRNPNN